MPLRPIKLVLLAALLLRLALSVLPGFSADTVTFLAWSRALVTFGPFHYYGNLWCDYPPGYLYALWLVGLAYRLFDSGMSGPLYAAAIKIPPILADVGLGWLFYRWLLPRHGERRAMLGAALWLFNPAVWINSAIWGQADSVFAFWLCAALRLLPARGAKGLVAGSFCLALALLTKLQGLLLLPLIAVWAWRAHGTGRALRFAAAVAGWGVALALPFWGSQRWTWLFDLYRSTASGYRYTALNAFNMWEFLGGWRPDSDTFLGVAMFHWGLALFAALYAWILWRLSREREPASFLLGAALVALGAFFVMTRMHERYVFIALPLLLMSGLAAKNGPSGVYPVYGVLSATLALNLLFVLYAYDPQRPAWAIPWGERLLGGRWVGRGAALANAFVLAASIRAFAKGRSFPVFSLPAALRPAAPPPATRRPASWRPRWNLEARGAVFFFLLAAALYLFRLGAPGVEVFDEVHHVKTARQFIVLEEPTEWTHPHLGKLAMAASISVFGDRSFAWRLPQALAGAGCVALVYLLGSALGASAIIGAFAALLLLCDGLHFGISRIGMLDAHAAFFILAAYLIVYRRFYAAWAPSERAWLGLGASLGLALSSKWTALYACGGVLCLMLFSFYRHRERAGRPAVFAARLATCLFLLPLTIYLLSFFRYVQVGHTLADVLQSQKSMWDYHAHISDVHSYSSAWWSWPLMLRPVWTYFKALGDGRVEGIVLLGNPAVFWACLPGLAYAAWRALRHRDVAAMFLLTAFSFQYLPWVVSPRKLGFFNHFHSSVPFLCLAIAMAMGRLGERPWGRRAVAVYLGTVIALFLYFYPILSAWPVSWAEYMQRMWLRSWI